MKPPVDTIRLNPKAREQLIRLKRYTGIEHWNILCRWAFCLSLRDSGAPPVIDSEKSTAVEMSWKVFAGDHDLVLSALYAVWNQNASSPDGTNSPDLVRRHIQRGLGILESQKISTVEDLLLLAY